MRQYLFLALFLLTGLAGSSAEAKEESWYLNLGVGAGVVNYPSSWNTGIFTANGLSREGVSLAGDMGVYFPLGKSNFLLGGAISFVIDRYSSLNSLLGLAMMFVNAGPSVMYFFGKEPGSGLFLRADVSYAKLQTNVSATLLVEGITGLSTTGALGWGIPVGSETRLLLSGNVIYSKLGSHNYLTYLGLLSVIF